MKVSVSQVKLAQLIGKVQGVVSLRPTIPVFGTALLQAEGNEIILTVTEAMLSMQGRLPAEVTEEGSIVLPARRLFQLIRELTTPSVELVVRGKEEALLLRTKGATFRINGMNSWGFPLSSAFPPLSGSSSIELQASLFKQVLLRSGFSAARDDNRTTLNGVLMHIEEGGATFIGTDGKRVAKIPLPLTADPLCYGQYLLPIKTVEELLRAIDGEETVRITLMKGCVGIELSPLLIMAKLLAGEYPDVELIIPKHTPFTVSLHREELLTLLKQVSLFTIPGKLSVTFSFHPGELTLLAHASEVGEGQVSMPVDYRGEPIQLFFNPFHFQDILRHSQDETVSFSFTGPHDPSLITDSTTARFVIMPMRIASS